MDFSSLIARKRDRFAELEVAVSAPDLYNDPKRAQELLRERNRLTQTLATWEEFERVQRELTENREMAKGADELAEMAQAELPLLEKRHAELERDVQFALLPPDPNEDRDAIIEIRAGAGGG